ncbi:hypothetical protein HPO96_09185 [Kribbella sandramycini]|uniref:Regulator of protease activity HflC (Stomatin/prohibitin superfamily) n=1 Tax=Kribbella sandramycini TaxID=60450 RepID=A0A7Y4KXF1_9ACTN|nr:SPFH domain-containing protein [Kribbella sandramycini]MBB6569755.1 regulator of protease activity HflC (stomatin/prohibitin superfamily) [Kribbella sandramycini]NOL40418.1 hypothetical protein [Kribbella sandramycini]
MTNLAATVFDPPGAHPWAVLMILLLLGAVAAAEPRVAGSDRQVVVLRAGRPRRVVSSGPVLRLPLIERYLWLPTAPTRQHFFVAGRTADGAELRLAGEVDVQVVDPWQAATAAADPVQLAVDEVERALGELIATSSVADVAGAALDVGCAMPGVRIGTPRIGTAEVELTTWVLRAVADQAK